MNKSNLRFITFESKNDKFIGYLSLEATIESQTPPEVLLNKAICIYENSIKKLKNILIEFDKNRKYRKPIPARLVWKFGNIIFGIKHSLAKLYLEVNGLYDHLIRDLNVKRKWLEKVIIFRRYIPDILYIPKSLNWGKCEKGTKRVAQNIVKKFVSK